MDKDKYIAERLGLCWHDPVFTSMGSNSIKHRCVRCHEIVPYVGYNPDFSTPAGTVLLLGLMMKRDDWGGDFGFQQIIGGPEYDKIDVSYITKPGTLRDAVYEFLRGREQ